MSNYICLSWTKKCLNNWNSEPFSCRHNGEFTVYKPFTNGSSLHSCCDVHKKSNVVTSVTDNNILYHIKKTYVRKQLEKLEKKNAKLG